MPVTAVVARDYSSGAPTTLETYAEGVKFLVRNGDLEIVSAASKLLGLYGSGNWLSVFMDDNAQVFSGQWQSPSASLGLEPAPESEPHRSLPRLDQTSTHRSLPGLDPAAEPHRSLTTLDAGTPHRSLPTLGTEPVRSLRSLGTVPLRSLPDTGSGPTPDVGPAPVRSAPEERPEPATRYASTRAASPAPASPPGRATRRDQRKQMPSHMTPVAFGPRPVKPPPEPADEPATSRFTTVSFGPRPVKNAEPPVKPEKAKRFQIVSFSRTYSAPGQPVRPPVPDDEDAAEE